MTKSNILNKIKLKKEEIDLYIIIGKDKYIIFKGKEFKKYSRYNIYNSKRKIKKLIYKYMNIRKDN